MLSFDLKKSDNSSSQTNADNNSELVLLPSKMEEMSTDVGQSVLRSWQLQRYLRQTAIITKVFLWIVFPIFLNVAFYSTGSNIENYGMAGLLQFTFVYEMAKFAVFSVAICVTCGAFFAYLGGSEAPFPSRIFLSDAGFAPWESSFLIPWETIRSVSTKELVYKGALRTNVLEIEAEYRSQTILTRIRRSFKVDGLRRAYEFFDPVKRRIPEERSNIIRLPLDIFAFEHDSQRLLAALREHVAPENFNCDVNSLPDKSVISAGSFTQLWLEDLRGFGTSNSPRVVENGRVLKNGKYKVTGVLGFGGYSVVYAASAIGDETDAGAPTTVAIKELVINSGGTRASKEAILKHVLAEVAILSKIDHPNIVKCLDFFIEAGKIYVVLEGIIAPNLRELINQAGKWDEQLIIRATLQCCSILEYLHGLPVPIIHRDFTPDNLILDSNNKSVKLIDFNVAEEANVNSSQTIIGKQCYMAPEQWYGQFTATGDLYQLGCTIYFIATGLEPEPLTQANPAASLGLSSRLCAIIRKLTEREPENRYASAKHLADDMKELELERSNSEPDPKFSDGEQLF
jgi:hypothetical protein